MTGRPSAEPGNGSNTQRKGPDRLQRSDLQERLKTSPGAGREHLSRAERDERRTRLQNYSEDINRSLKGSPVKLVKATKEIVMQPIIHHDLVEAFMNGLEEAMVKKRLPQHLLGLIRPLNNPSVLKTMKLMDMLEERLGSPQQNMQSVRDRIQAVGQGESSSMNPDHEQLKTLQRKIRRLFIDAAVRPQARDTGVFVTELRRHLKQVQQMAGKYQVSIQEKKVSKKAERAKATQGFYFGAAPGTRRQPPQNTEAQQPDRRAPQPKRRRPPQQRKRPPQGRGGRQSA